MAARPARGISLWHITLTQVTGIYFVNKVFSFQDFISERERVHTRHEMKRAQAGREAEAEEAAAPTEQGT